MPLIKRDGLKVPLLLNVGLIPVLALFAYGFSFLSTSGNSNQGDAVLTLFFLLSGLFLLNGMAIIGCLVMRRKDLAMGFLLGGLLVLLVGLGSCSYALEHLNFRAVV